MSDLFDKVAIIHGDEKRNAMPMDLMAQGGTLEQIKTDYVTALRVQKPRDIDKIVTAIMSEAEYAGDDWYYSWSVNDKRTGKKSLVEGASIGCAYAVMREWGNCAVDAEYEERGGTDIFTAKFLDLEKGVTQTRIFRQRKRVVQGGYDSDRFDDMQFQIAQSKAIRNVIIAGVPRWLTDAAVSKAKTATVNMIAKLGIHAARQQAVDFFTPYDIEVEQIEHLLQKKKDKWTNEDLAQLRGLAKNIKDGQVDPNEAFPILKSSVKEEDEKAKRHRRTKAEMEAEKKPEPAPADLCRYTKQPPDPAMCDNCQTLEQCDVAVLSRVVSREPGSEG